MSNMSYVRFQNTLKDLADCQDALDANDDVEGDEEENARNEIVEMCCNIALNHGSTIVGREINENDSDY